MKHKIVHTIIAAFLLFTGVQTFAIDYAATTVDKATVITKSVDLKVQDGANFVKISPENLPVKISYLPDTAFGPLPTAIVNGTDTLPAKTVFENCKMKWQWELIDETDQTRIVNVFVHENAIIHVETNVCLPTAGDTTAAVCGGLEWKGKWYDASGHYPVKLVNAAGCDSICTLHLTVYEPTPNTDTTAVVWDSITWYGTKYTSSGDYSIEKKDGNNCDYTHTLHLTVHTTTYHNTVEQACDSLWLNGKKYTENGEYVIDTVVDSKGDRCINSMTLTINSTQYSEETLTKCYSYNAPSGKEYTVSGEYKDSTLLASGCYSIVTLYLTIIEDCTQHDTIYFCAGLNKEHEERDGEWIHHFLPYKFESPATWNYMEGVILEGEVDRTLVNLKQAEQNLYEHYVGELMPVQSIAWSVRYEGTNTYVPLQVADGQQWVNAGLVVMQVRFLCGNIFNADFATDIIVPETNTIPVKRIENGNVIILRSGNKYSILGTKID